ncbi:MAG: hypothetical protein FJ399_05470 [Verrucomicrobia bacterium]|nr:hypothetical protein [Verrucomicrobiota bacterium]
MRPLKRNSGPNALRRGRQSSAGSCYFVTLCLHPRRPVLESPVAAKISAECRHLHEEAAWSLRCMTIMPDHLHLFFRLGRRLTLSQAMARLKAKSRRLFQAPSTDWQKDFYNHRMRPQDSVERVIRYIWLNPYVDGLISQSQVWPHFHCCEEDWSWFSELTDENRPFPDWLR